LCVKKLKDDKNIIKDLSKAIGNELNQVNAMSDTSVGFSYKFDDENITELGLDLSKLDLDENKLTFVGELVKKLQNLKSFYIKFSKKDDLPNWLMQLTKLELLSLRDNNLQIIPDGIRNFTSLKSLNLASNNIIVLTDWLLDLSELNELNLDRNTYLDWNQVNLKILRDLQDRGAKISAPRLFHFQLKYNLPSEQIEIIRVLEKDNIEKERMRQYVNPINVEFENKKLIKWKLYEYSFKTLPENFGVFKDLKSLIITHTPLEVLPESFGELTNLEFLDLSNNRLSQLPESFGNLVLISKLNLSKNNFNLIPTQIWNFNELTELNLSDNPLNDEEKNIIQKIPDIIRDYLRKKATIRVFISHAVIDFEEYRIEQLVEFLKNQKEISEVYFCEEDLAGNIDEWMLDTVQKSQLLLFIATKKSVFDSVDCHNELQLADKFSIPIIPLKGEDIDWGDLAELKLSRELGIEFEKNRFDDFCTDLYKYILNFKREIDLMSEKGRKQGITDIYERFRLLLNENLDNLKRKINQLEERIKKLEE